MGSWLVTWEAVGDSVKSGNMVAAILNYRLSGETVRSIIELLYVNSRLDLSGRVAYAKNKKGVLPYPAQFHTLDGVPWDGRITCGYQPYLYARLVDDLHVEVDEDGEEKLIWKERPIPRSIEKLRKMMKGREAPDL